MNISEAAKITGLTAATLRYYESEGLIPPVTRKNGGVRDYQQDDLGWIDFIKCMRSAGMSVDSLIEYTTLFRNGTQSDEARKNILIRERDQLLAKQKEISETIERLNGKIKSFEGKMRESEDSLMHWNRGWSKCSPASKKPSRQALYLNVCFDGFIVFQREISLRQCIQDVLDDQFRRQMELLVKRFKRNIVRKFFFRAEVQNFDS